MISGVASGLTGMLGSFGGGSTPMASPTTQYNPFTTSTLGTLTPQVQLTGFMNQPFNQTSSQFFNY
jgi:hypothetical protein